MNIWKWLFGFKESSPKNDDSIENIVLLDIQSNDFEYSGAPAQKTFYPFGTRVSKKNWSNLIHYIYLNIGEYEKQGDKMEFAGFELSVSSLKSHIKFNDEQSFEICLFVKDVDVWFKVSSLYNYGNISAKMINELYSTREKKVIPEHLYNSEQKIYDLIYKLATESTFTQSPSFIREKFNKSYNFHKMSPETYYKVGDGEYYLYSGITDYYCLYRFDDWKCINDLTEIISCIGFESRIEKCEDPRKEHWQHFIHLKYKTGLENKLKVKSYVSDIIQKHKEYEEIMLHYGEIVTRTTMTDYSDLCEFCEKINHDIPYKWQEIEIAFKEIRNEMLVDKSTTTIYNNKNIILTN